MAYGGFKDLDRRTTADELLHVKTFNIAKNPSIVHIFLDKKTSDGTSKHEITSNKKFAEELHKPIIRKFEKRKLHSTFIDNIREKRKYNYYSFQKFLDESDCKPKKIWVEKGSECYNVSMK